MEKTMTIEEKVMMNVGDKLWTRQREMIKELEELDYIVTSVNSEYVSVVDGQDEEEHEFILYLGHAHSTMWIENVRTKMA